MSTTTKTTKTAKTAANYDGFSAEERAAMKQRAKELKESASKAEAENAVLAKIAEMRESDRVIAERIHAIVKANAPTLWAKTWYGMPAYATPGKDGKIVCFFTPAEKFNTRYATFSFDNQANLDDGNVWPVAFAVAKLTAADEKRLGALVKQAVS